MSDVMKDIPGFPIAKNNGEITIDLRFFTGTVGDVIPIDILKHMVDRMVEVLRTDSLFKCGELKATGVYEPFRKIGERTTYEKEVK